MEIVTDPAPDVVEDAWTHGLAAPAGEPNLRVDAVRCQHCATLHLHSDCCRP